MTRCPCVVPVAMVLSIVVFTWSPLARGEGPADGEAERIVRLAGLDRGVAVVVGLDDGGADLAIALARGSQLLVEGVDVDPARLAEARERLAEARTQPGGGQRGTDRAGRGCEVFAARWDGRRLPYVEHFINLLVLRRPGELTDEKAIGRAVGKAGEQLVRQARALRGEEGGLFYVASAEDGSELSRRRLPDVPVFDGLAAAYGRAYVSLADGSILCLSPRE